uniref:Reverse transcriptase domain-containing protein n=1 Tax=Oncorhynchus mykiss TaxID=8022 RepID=A0A8C7UQS5_ONCMY
MLSSWLPQPRPTVPYCSYLPKPPQLLLHQNPDSRCSERAVKPLPMQISWARQSGPSLSKMICRQPLLPVCSTSLSYRPRSLKIGKLPRSSPSSKGVTLDPNCYRPISILPCLSKVFESQVNKQITDHFESHCTFSAVQSGFLAGHGCTSATLKVLNDIITAIDKILYCAAVFIDLAKAFDSVNHRILIGRLNSLGFSNDCLAWFTNYFSDRFQCEKIRGCTMGVPQGSILEPTLFSVYINDVALTAGDSLIHLYADDTILYTSGPSLDTVLTNLQTSFNTIQHSFRGLQLLLNTNKTKCMLFNRSLPAPARPTSITTLDGSDLEYVDNYKYLGVWLDCKLSFQTHITHLQSKIKSRIPISQQSLLHSRRQTYPSKTDYPTDPRLRRCHLPNSLQHSTQQTGCSLSQ